MNRYVALLFCASVVLVAAAEVLPEIVRTDCAKCTETQHKKIGGFFGEVSRRHPDLMKKLLDKYDPSGEYRKKYAKSWADGAEVSGDRPPLPPPATPERYAATPGHARPAYKPRQSSLRHSRQQVAHSADTTSMNRHVALLLCASLALVAAAEEKYPATFDSLDLKELLSDETRVQDAMRCLLEEGDAACRPAGKALKEVLPEIVRTDCAKCTETQHKKIGGFFGEVSRRHPDLMKKLLDKYDPSGEYRKKYAKSWAEYSIHH
ncbi:uncharacterized protein LOC124616444 [Schistocerca americana]|uniref:uncharacterized protein LOC124616442 n=2 Tax=Schistocerca americana TaxID=7009 RepID=UPI001F4FB095|nr:uncharacterized protein LOC124616442 [Schistocerca americana]XP_047000709.1 uncharacterized protein LOC124616444 [Schistocerca americana]